MINDPEALDNRRRVEEDHEDALEDENDEDEEYDMPPALIGQPSSPKRIATPAASSSPIRLEIPSELQGITRKMDSMKIGNRRIDVNV
jgi:hypothetical protein